LWSVGSVIIREQRQRKIRNKGSWGRCSCATCSAEATRKHGTGEIGKQRMEEQKG